jgi:Fur family transcriptional regulator, ferric uptake regulator
MADHVHDHIHAHAHPEQEGAVALERALEALRDAGHRITAPRRALLGLLIQEHGPFSAEELHRRLPEGMCDPVTVYRSIGALEETNLVRRCDFGDGTYRYEFNTGEHHHHHIICRHCSSVQNLEVCFADGLERLVRQMGYTNVTHTLEIFGTCVSCQKAV